ncbi:hypothetical protein conserved [Leishmania donovani]|uniref:Uncharacterized protein n=3 Tax=Leishmania donovani species complex TaxID=38574 RepID=A4I1D8_LEIIN|nr:conserved hypothetical protein [Leishmania infantum JPCM5]CAC9494021.1 hypothetical_protein_-_conserved [Leishmania infantum]CAJ1989424.1 hypothetical protein conserved [Leishmania donovani]CAM68568.1 conserved hypothetical protein [Leishmania infantum JPCM5]SUZ42426.1 hypothetical_protein_-_conserved [Leishmania infantum]VDZ45291.1 hypothetical_protein_conserved [Leishmania donovani]|eukprot:XP_001466129.1 conserved hypothetical protein [Leishmania infantum JPCM5]
MSVLPAGADRAAVQELEALFRTADPTNTGLLSYSEFAYLILRSGGTQKQADALIEKFAGPSRAQRVVYYGALLEQLYDYAEATADAHGDVENGSARHTSDPLLRISSLDCTSSMPALDTSNSSPLPTPPAPTGVGPSSWHASHSPIAGGGGAAAAAAPAPRDVMGAGQYVVPSAALSSSPLYRSVSHAGAGGRSASTLASRESSTATYATYTTCNDRSLPHLRSDSSATPPRRPLRSPSSPHSSRFVESALRTATAAAAGPHQQQRLDRAPSQGGTHVSWPASRSRSRDDVRATPLTGSSVVGTQGGERARVYGATSAPQYAAGDGRYSYAPRACDPTPVSIGHRRRESSTERMVRAAAEVSIHGRPQSRFDAEGSVGAGETREGEGKRRSSVARVLPDALRSASSSSYAAAPHLVAANRASRTAAPQAENTSTLFTASRASDSYVSHVNHSGHSSYHSDAAATSLLSLRDIFQRHLAPRSSRDGTVLLSELEEALATRGVGVHPLELEAVADSLELAAVPAAIEHHGSALQHHSFNASLKNGFGASVATAGRMLRDSPHPWRSVSASGMDSTDASATTASRATLTGGTDRALSLVDFCVLVSRLRPALIQRIRSPGVWEGAASIDGVEVLQSRQPPPVNSRLESRGAVESDDGDSIADVTVSPMTPEAAAPATPRSTVSSSSTRPHSSAQRHLRRRRSLVPHRFADLHRPLSAAKVYGAAASASTSTAPPTARQLSADQQFAVEHAQREPRRSKREEDSDDGCHASVRYAQPTAASEQRRNGLDVPSATTARLNRTKVPLWHDGRRLGARRSHTDATRSPSSTSPGSSRGLISPDERHHPQQPRPHRAHIALRSPTSDFSARVVHKELGDGLARRGCGRMSEPWPTTTSAELSPTSRALSSPQSINKRGPTSSMLAPRVLETLQSAALPLLRRCAQLDSRHTGRMAPSAWLRVLRDACPALTDAERLRVQEWIRSRGQRSACGADYAAVVEDILTEASIVPLTPASGAKSSACRRGDSTAAASPLRASATRMRSYPQRQDAAATRSSVPYTSTTKDASPASSRSAAKPRAAVRSGPSGRVPVSSSHTTANGQMTDEDAKRLLAHELMTACGGDTEALLGYFRAFDEAGTGLLVEHVWRASLEELFRRTEGREAPAWVVGGCVRLSRVPLERPAATPSPQRGTPPLVSPALSAARARVSRVPPAMRGTLCDYRYVLEELGVHADG